VVVVVEQVPMEKRPLLSRLNAHLVELVVEVLEPE
jgi:hypothetical protein